MFFPSCEQTALRFPEPPRILKKDSAGLSLGNLLRIYSWLVSSESGNILLNIIHIKMTNNTNMILISGIPAKAVNAMTAITKNSIAK